MSTYEPGLECGSRYSTRRPCCQPATSRDPEPRQSRLWLGPLRPKSSLHSIIPVSIQDKETVLLAERTTLDIHGTARVCAFLDNTT